MGTKYRLIKYYVWRNTDKHSWTLDFMGNDLGELFGDQLITTFRAKTWKRAQERFQEIRAKYRHESY